MVARLNVRVHGRGFRRRAGPRVVEVSRRRVRAVADRRMADQSEKGASLATTGPRGAINRHCEARIGSCVRIGIWEGANLGALPLSPSASARWRARLATTGTFDRALRGSCPTSIGGDRPRSCAPCSSTGLRRRNASAGPDAIRRCSAGPSRRSAEVPSWQGRGCRPVGSSST